MIRMMIRIMICIASLAVGCCLGDELKRPHGSGPGNHHPYLSLSGNVRRSGASSFRRKDFPKMQRARRRLLLLPIGDSATILQSG
jgi:hypothetical protein